MAVVVSFNGRGKIVETIESLAGQVDHVHVVDNASDPESLEILQKLSLRPGISITWLAENKGIGCALNIGVKLAREQNYRWLLTMDQDSIIGMSMVEAFAAVVDRNPDMLCLAANYSASTDNEVSSALPVKYAITSGNLIRIDVYDRVGLYDEDLFIDGVDFDFSLRVIKSGLAIYQVTDAQMQHELGDSVCGFPMLGRIHTYHSPERRYYMYRNFLYLLKEYAVEFPTFFLKLAILQILYVFTVLIFGEQRLRSMALIGRGLFDYFRGIKGPLRKS